MSSPHLKYFPLQCSQRDAAQAQLDLLLAGSRPEQIAIAQVGIEQALLSVAQAEVAVAQAEAALVQAQAGVAQAVAARDVAQIALNRAPIDGTVASLNIEL